MIITQEKKGGGPSVGALACAIITTVTNPGCFFVLIQPEPIDLVMNQNDRTKNLFE